MSRKLYLYLIFTLFVFVSASAEGLEAMKGKIPGGYNFWFYSPVNDSIPEASETKPLVVFLHGRSLCGNDLNKVRRYGTISAIEKGREIDAYVIAPQNPGGSWQPEKIMDVVDYVCENYNVDENRIYALGMSLGGYGTLDFAATYPDRIAAAVGLCGGATVKDLSGLAKVPLWIVHGEADSKVPVGKSDAVVEAVWAAQGDDGEDRLVYDRIPGVNHSQLAKVLYNVETYEWLFSHSLLDTDRKLVEPAIIDNDFFARSYSGLNHSKGYKGSSSK